MHVRGHVRGFTTARRAGTLKRTTGAKSEEHGPLQNAQKAQNSEDVQPATKALRARTLKRTKGAKSKEHGKIPKGPG